MSRNSRIRSFTLMAAAAALAAAATAVFSPTSVPAGEAVSYLNPVRMSEGDDPAWALPGLDDTAWEEIEFHAVPGGRGILWLRGSMDLAADSSSWNRPFGLEIAAMATCEIYWDGELIPGSGVVGATAAEEQPGPLIRVEHIPDRLATRAEHSIALRCSAHHRGFEPATGFWYARGGEYGTLVTSAARHTWPATLSLSAMVIAGFFYLLLFALDRRHPPALLLGLFGLAGAALLLAESWRSLVPYTYDWHLVRLVAVTGLSWLLNVLLAFFFATRFPTPVRRIFLAAAVALATLPVGIFESWDAKAGFMFLGVGILTLGYGVAVTWRGLEGSALATAGVATLLAIDLAEPFSFLDRNLFIALDVLLMCLLASHALQVRKARRDREEALVRSARLEIELLKKHLQPHFLMNTLTALAEWFDEEPAVAGDMIQALAEEFRVLTEISSQRLVPLKGEIRLCRSHLEVMSHRKARAYRLVVSNVDEQELIPPAVFHTLIENAITRNAYPEPEVTFHLRSEPAGRFTRYVFEAPLAAGVASKPREEGTGLRYVRARLREGFGDGWRLEEGPRGNVWRTEISVPGDPSRGELRPLRIESVQ